MNDTGTITTVGIFGTITSLTLAQVNTIVGITAGVLTCIYVGQGIYKRWKNRNERTE